MCGCPCFHVDQKKTKNIDEKLSGPHTTMPAFYDTLEASTRDAEFRPHEALLGGMDGAGVRGELGAFRHVAAELES